MKKKAVAVIKIYPDGSSDTKFHETINGNWLIGVLIAMVVNINTKGQDLKKKILSVLGIGGKTIREGDRIRAWKDCGDNAKKGKVYEVVVIKTGYIRKPSEPKLAINPIDDGKCFTACSCYDKWELVSFEEKEEENG